MLGVVLWSDTNNNKAVIWCEDHGDLAFFNGGSEQPDALLGLDAGDLVQFELSEERHQRYAKNPRPVMHGAYAGLPDTLCAQSQESMIERRPVSRQTARPSFETGEVIPFAAARARQTDRSLELA